MRVEISNKGTSKGDCCLLDSRFPFRRAYYLQNAQSVLKKRLFRFINYEFQMREVQKQQLQVDIVGA